MKTTKKSELPKSPNNGKKPRLDPKKVEYAKLQSFWSATRNAHLYHGVDTKAHEMQKAYYSNKDELYWQPLIADNSPEMDFGNIPLNKRNILEDLYIHFVKRYGPAYAALAHAEDLSGRMNDWYVIYIQQTGDELRMMHNSNTLDLFWQKCLESLELRTTNSKGKLKKNLSATLEVISMALRELSKIRTGKKFRKAYRLAENEFLENGRPFTWQQLEKAANNISSRNGLDEFAETYSKEIASVFGQISKRL